MDAQVPGTKNRVEVKDGRDGEPAETIEIDPTTIHPHIVEMTPAERDAVMNQLLVQHQRLIELVKERLRSGE